MAPSHLCLPRFGLADIKVEIVITTAMPMMAMVVLTQNIQRINSYAIDLS
tara:strand:+ start:295 stop:444 length:150 start_codon:yes stop_codon:yes gene_type:complete